MAEQSEEEREVTHLTLKTLKDFTFDFGFKKFCVVRANGFFNESSHSHSHSLSLSVSVFRLGFCFLCVRACGWAVCLWFALVTKRSINPSFGWL